jgi:hypothetical protein
MGTMVLDHSQTPHSRLFQLIATEINMNWKLQLCKYIIQLTDKTVAGRGGPNTSIFLIRQMQILQQSHPTHREEHELGAAAMQICPPTYRQNRCHRSKYFNFLKFQKPNGNVPPNAAMK